MLEILNLFVKGGAVVFDDIEETWHCEDASDSSPSPTRNCHPGPPAHYFKVINLY